MSFWDDFKAAQNGVRRPRVLQTHPDTAKKLGIDPALVDAIMDGSITDHPYLHRVDGPFPSVTIVSQILENPE